MGSVVVVGGGVAGLTCAFRLARAGHNVEVLELERTPGGRMRTEQHGDFLVDRGAQFVSASYANLQSTARALGLADRRRSVSPTSNAILRDGRFHSGDYDRLSAFAKSPLLGVRAKLRLGRALVELARHWRALDPAHPEAAASLDGEDLATGMRRLVGDEAFEYLFQPAISSTFDSDPEDLSLVFGLLLLRFVSSGVRLETFEGGPGALTRALAERVSVRTGCDVTKIETETDGARVQYRAGAHEGRVLADAVVVAVPGSKVAALCPKLTPEERGFFEGVRYVRGAIVHCLLPERPRGLPWYGVAFPRREGLGLYGLAADHAKPGAAPEGRGLVNTALTAESASRLWNATDDEVAAFALGELARTPLGQLRPDATVVHRWDAMLPQFYAGYLPRLARFLARSDRSPRLAFAGDYLVGPTTELALTSGMRAAAELAAAL